MSSENPHQENPNGRSAAREPIEEGEIFQRLDITEVFPYTFSEYFRRYLWRFVELTLVRCSPNRAFGWRRRLLRLFGADIAKTARINPDTRIMHPWLLKMGEHSHLDNITVYNLGQVTIGSQTVVSQNSYLCAGSHDYTKRHLPLLRPSLTIGSGVWICADSFIGPGVTIGNNSIIGARSVVMRDVPAGEIHAGNPAEFIKKRPLGPSNLEGPSRALRLTIVTGPFNALPPAPCGAMEMVWMGLAQELNRMGHRVTMLSRGYEGFPSQEDRDGIRILRRTQFKRSRFREIDLIKDFFYGLRWLPEVPPSDVVVTNTLFLPAMMSISHRSRSKINVNMNRFPKRQAWIYLRTHRLAAASGAVADAVAAQTPPAKKKDLLRVMPNPIRTDVFTPPTEGRDFTTPQKTIIYTGRINKEKGLHLLVGAFRLLSKEHPELKLRLIGPSALEQGGGGKPYLEKLKEMADGAAISIEDPIFDREELANALRNAHYYCYPSVAYYGEACPVAPIEAMATGLVPVVSDLPQFLEYLVPGDNGLVFEREAPDAESQLAAHLKALIDDPALTERMGQRAAERAKQFSYNAIARSFLKDCAELLEIDPSEVLDDALKSRDHATTDARGTQAIPQQEAEVR